MSDPKQPEIDMICTCDEPGRAAAAALMIEVARRLSEGSEELSPRPVTKENFLTAVVQSLNWDFNAHISSILNDQWSCVVAENRDASVRYSVLCDEVEHGVAAVWMAFADGPDSLKAFEAQRGD